MKRLDDLGVSPAPWTAENGPFVSMVYENAPTDKCASVCGLSGERRKADSRLIAAAPDLYEALREALREAVDWRCCDECDAYALVGGGRCAEINGECLIHRWRRILEKAGGAE